MEKQKIDEASKKGRGKIKRN